MIKTYFLLQRVGPTILKGLLALSILSLLINVSSQAQTIRYVKPIPSGSEDGSSWANATNNLQTAINSLTTTGGQVWIASGLYKPTTTTGPDSHTISFEMKNKVSIYGGFAGSEASLDDRVLSYPSSTTLSGNIGDATTNADNSIHVLTGIKVDSTTVLDGLVVTGGNAASPGYPGDTGSGGGLYVEMGSLRLNNCYFINNKGKALFSTNYGGERYTAGPINNFHVTNCVFQANEGGGIGIANAYNTNTNFVMVNCVLRDNVVHDSNTSYDNNTSLGGAIYVAGAGKLKLVNCTFRNNHARKGGLIGWYYGSGGLATVDMVNCIALANQDELYHDSFYAVTLTIRYSIIDQVSSNFDSTVVVTTTSPFVSETSEQLSNCSPAIDGGDPTTTVAMAGAIDLAGNPRFIRSRIDMGAYEFQGVACAQQNGYIYTLQAGRWDDVATWSVGRLPASSDNVLLKHSVTIPQNYQAHAQQLRLDPYGRLIYETSGRLLLNQ